MCLEAPIRWACCGKEWVPEPGQDFTRPLLAICDQVQVRPETSMPEGFLVIRTSPCANLVRGVPAEGWNGVEALTYPSYSCPECIEGIPRFSWEPAPVEDKDARPRLPRRMAVNIKRHAELEGIRCVFNSHPRLLSDIWPLIDHMSSIKAAFNSMWDCALDVFEIELSWACGDLIESQLPLLFGEYCWQLDSLTRWSVYYRRCDEDDLASASDDESLDTEREPEAEGMDTAPEDKGVSEGTLAAAKLVSSGSLESGAASPAS